MRRRGVGPGMAARRGARMAVRMMARRRRRRRRRRVILAGGLIAIGVHKLSKHDVEKVEAKTGKPAEELTDEELEQVMAELNIAANEMTDEEMDQVDAADPEGDDEDYIAQLERLAKLHEQGILTDEEFAAKKAQLLGL